MPVSREFVQAVRKRAAEDPGVSLSSLARALHSSEAEVILALPVHMRMRARITDCPAIWERLNERKSMLVCRGPEGEVRADFSACLCPGGILPEKSPPAEELGSIWFLSRASENEERRSLRFFGPQGQRLLVVHMDAVAADFDEMRAFFGVRPVPRKRCGGCGGCGRCSCGHKSGAGTEENHAEKILGEV
jgi:hypothetical protein